MAQKKRDYTIRNMTKADLPEIYRIEKVAHELPWTEGIIEDCLNVNYYCLVMERAGNIISYAITSIEAGECHTFNLTVNPEFHRQGYGAALLDYLKMRCKKKDCRSIYLEVRRSNEPAIHFYKKLGFTRIAMRKDYYEDDDHKEDAFLYRLNF